MPAVRTVLPSPSAGNLELVIAASPDASPGVRLSNGYFYGSSLKHRDRRHRRALPSCIPPFGVPGPLDALNANKSRPVLPAAVYSGRRVREPQPSLGLKALHHQRLLPPRVFHERLARR